MRVAARRSRTRRIELTALSIVALAEGELESIVIARRHEKDSVRFGKVCPAAHGYQQKKRRPGFGTPTASRLMN